MAFIAARRARRALHHRDTGLHRVDYAGHRAGAPARLSRFPLDVKNADITRAVVLVHGAGRDADNYFLHILAAAFLSGALDNTVVLSPRFASTNNGCSDKVAEREAAWECSGPARWTAGGDAVGSSGVTSFDAMDNILTRLARRVMSRTCARSCWPATRPEDSSSRATR